MTRRTDAHPDLTRPEADAPFFSLILRGTPGLQDFVAESANKVLQSRVR